MSTHPATVVANPTHERMSAGRAAWLSLGITASSALGMRVADWFPTIPWVVFYVGFPAVTTRLLRGTWWPPTTLVRGPRWAWITLGLLTTALVVLVCLQVHDRMPRLEISELELVDAILFAIVDSGIVMGLAWFERTNQFAMCIVSMVLAFAAGCVSTFETFGWEWSTMLPTLPWVLMSIVVCIARVKLGLAGATLLPLAPLLALIVALAG